MGCIQGLLMPDHLKLHCISPCVKHYCTSNTCQCDVEIDNSDSDNDHALVPTKETLKE